MAPGRPSKNAGQPQPETNFVVDLYRGVPQPAQLKKNVTVEFVVPSCSR
jgi:hypothetical protein